VQIEYIRRRSRLNVLGANGPIFAQMAGPLRFDGDSQARLSTLARQSTAGIFVPPCVSYPYRNMPTVLAAMQAIGDGVQSPKEEKFLPKRPRRSRFM
jgi:hypothetical protein